jgi:hypothetical protein
VLELLALVHRLRVVEVGHVHEPLETVVDLVGAGDGGEGKSIEKFQTEGPPVYRDGDGDGDEDGDE